MLRQLVLIGALAAVAAAQTVDVSLTSPQAGLAVEPGAAVTWSISATVSPGDNAGLALIVLDLVQDAGNPATLDLPPAGGVPAAMTNFSRPAGISNPGEGGATTGYIGVQRGSVGAMNLIQIGGGQNNFGVALPAGAGVATNANVVPGVGQAGAVEIASGSFFAPSTCGSYTYSLQDVAANVFTTVNAPPNASPAVNATVVVSAASISFSVTIPGDIDGNGSVDLTDLAVMLSAFGSCSGNPNYVAAADLDNSGCIDLADLATQLAAFGSSCP